MSDTVPDLSDEPPEVRGMYPGAYWNEDRDEKREERKAELKRELPDADIVGIVDSDSDGLACEVVLHEAYPDKNTVVLQGNGGEYGWELPESVSFVGRYTTADTDVIIADLAPDAQFSSFVASVSMVDAPVSIYDHHEWSWSARQSMELVADEIVIGDDKCAAQVLQEERYPDADDQLLEFLTVTADHDLWRKEDERSDYLSTLAFTLDRAEYVEAARQYGADMIEESDRLRQRYELAEEESEERAELAIERADWEEINEHTVAITYFACHQSRVGDRLLTQGADLAVIIQPTLKLSFRSADNLDRCAELARGLGGGGHATAAGAPLYRHIDASFEETWETEGAEAIHFIKMYLRNNL